MKLFALTKDRFLTIGKARYLIINYDISPIEIFKESEHIDTLLSIEMEQWWVNALREQGSNL